jgi:uncharacterized damage-inducible protein DinB
MNIAFESPFLIKPIPGFTPHMGHLISMLHFVRLTTLKAVEGLSTQELDFLMDAESNSIGMLLAHIAAVETWYQIATFENREPTKAEENPLAAALDLGEQGRQEIKGHALPYYLAALEQVRNKTYEELAKRDDAWLHEEIDWWGNSKANYYFAWFHVLEDELNHRGQIRIIRKLLLTSREQL